jgi:hypothetical protein
MCVKAMMTITVHLAVLVLASPLVLSAQRVEPIKMGKGLLVVHPVDAYGGAVAGADIRVYSITDGKSVRVDWSPDKQLPFGTYKLEVTASGAVQFSEVISVEGQRVDVVACLRLGRIADERASPLSRISIPGGYHGCKQALIQPMFGPGNRLPLIALVHEGSFFVEGLDAGRYVAVIVSPDKYCGAVAFDVTYHGAKIVGIEHALGR